MTLPILMLAGAGIGIGVLILAASLRRPLPSLSEAIHASPPPPPSSTAPPARPARRWRWRSYARFGLDRLLTDTVRRDLRALAAAPKTTSLAASSPASNSAPSPPHWRPYWPSKASVPV